MRRDWGRFGGRSPARWCAWSPTVPTTSRCATNPRCACCKTLGVRRPPIEQTADPAFALSPAAPEAVDALFQAENLPRDEPLIGVALRPWGGSGESPLDAYAQLLLDLHRRTGQRVVLLPMQMPGDVVFSETVAALTGDPAAFPVVRNVYPPAVLLGLVARMQAVVAMRLHTLIFAARAAVPPFALSYDPKVENLMRGLGLADSLEHWRGFDPAEVGERVAALLAERPARVSPRCAPEPPTRTSRAPQRRLRPRSPRRPPSRQTVAPPSRLSTPGSAAFQVLEMRRGAARTSSSPMGGIFSGTSVSATSTASTMV